MSEILIMDNRFNNFLKYQIWTKSKSGGANSPCFIGFVPLTIFKPGSLMNIFLHILGYGPADIGPQTYSFTTQAKK
jgi:hypothetical protein